MSVALEWRDLLSVPFAEATCWALACEVNRRLGRELPELGCTQPTLEESMSGQAALARVVGSPEVGDILLSDPQELGYPSHCAVVVADGWALSTAVGRSSYCHRIQRTPRELGVWRLR